MNLCKVRTSASLFQCQHTYLLRSVEIGKRLQEIFNLSAGAIIQPIIPRRNILCCAITGDLLMFRHIAIFLAELLFNRNVTGFCELKKKEVTHNSIY